MGLHKPTNILKTEVDTLILGVTQLAIWQALSGKASPDSAGEPLCSLGLRIQDSLCLEHPSPSLGLTPIGLSGPFAASPGKTSWISTPIWVIPVFPSVFQQLSPGSECQLLKVRTCLIHLCVHRI